MNTDSKARDIARKVKEVFDLLEAHGDDDYIGEEVSQIEHAVQAAQWAEKEGHEEEVILAALLHDIGHLCVEAQGENDMGGYGVVSHEKVGADFLRARGFSEKIARLIENHVDAKRYLTARNREYFERLSEASLKTLEYQGGPMSEAEADAFEQDPLFQLSIKVRAWDELAKETNKPVPPLDRYKQMALHHLS